MTVAELKAELTARNESTKGEKKYIEQLLICSNLRNVCLSVILEFCLSVPSLLLTPAYLTTKGQNFIRPKTHYAEKLVRVDLRSRCARSGPTALIFLPYLAFQTIIGIFECEKGYLCSLVLKDRNKIRPFKPFDLLSFLNIRLLFF